MENPIRECVCRFVDYHEKWSGCVLIDSGEDVNVRHTLEIQLNRK